MDVSALYPSITRELAMESIIKSVKKSDIVWDDVDYRTLSRYLSVTCDRNVLVKHKIDSCVPIAKTKTTLNSFTNPENTGRRIKN